MKKLLVAMGALVALAGSAFALDMNAEVNFTVPMAWGAIGRDAYDVSNFRSSTTTNTTENLKVSSEAVLNIGFGAEIGLDVMFTKVLGVGVDLGFNGSTFYTQPMFLKYEGVTGTFYNDFTSDSFMKMIDEKKINKDFKQTNFGFNFFAGLAIRPVFNDKFSLVITPGLDYDLHTYKTVNTKVDNAWLKVASNRVGIGVDVRAAFRITKMFAINVGTFESIQFFEAQTVNVKSVTGNMTHKDSNGMFLFKWAPRVGAAVYF